MLPSWKEKRFPLRIFVYFFSPLIMLRPLLFWFALFCVSLSILCLSSPPFPQFQQEKAFCNGRPLAPWGILVLSNCGGLGHSLSPAGGRVGVGTISGLSMEVPFLSSLVRGLARGDLCIFLLKITLLLFPFLTLLNANCVHHRNKNQKLDKQKDHNNIILTT